MARGHRRHARRGTRHRRLADVQAGLRPRHRRVPDRPVGARLPVHRGPRRRRCTSRSASPAVERRRGRDASWARSSPAAGPRHRAAPRRRARAALWRAAAPWSTVAPAERGAARRRGSAARARPASSSRDPRRRRRGDDRRSGSAAGWRPRRPPAWLDRWSRSLDDARLVARGPKARGALQAAGLVADWVAESETSAEIADFLLAEGVDGQRIAVQHHGAATTSCEDRLADGGAAVLALEVYRWGPPPDPDAVAAPPRARPPVTTTPCSSPRRRAPPPGCRRAGRAARRRARARDAGELILAAVGPVTAEPLESRASTWWSRTAGRMGALVRLVIMELGSDWASDHRGPLRVRAGGGDAGPPAAAGVSQRARGAAAAGQRARPGGLARGAPARAARESSDPHAAEVAVARLREALGQRG